VAPPKPARLSLRDHLALGLLGIRTRKARGALSALGIAVGIAALVGVMGLAEASRADLLAQLKALGTNMLAAAPGQTPFGDAATLPASAPGMLGRIPSVEHSAAVYTLESHIFKNDYISPAKTSGLTVAGTDLTLLDAVRGQVAAGRWLDAASSTYPAVVLGSKAAERLGITTLDAPVAVWIEGRWFGIVGILQPLELAPELNTTALMGAEMARYLQAEAEGEAGGGSGNGSDAGDGIDADTVLAPTRVYLRVMDGLVEQTRDLVPRTANPAAPSEVDVTRPSDVLAAQAVADSSLTTLSLGLGAVGLAVGGLGIANVGVVAVMERTGEIGLRRALGARRRAIRRQFLVEAVLLAVIGGVAGAAAGAAGSIGFEVAHAWPTVVPWAPISIGVGASAVIGALAATWPAVRAARVSPTEALRAGG
jgi:putative ABC transport system permease protein